MPENQVSNIHLGLAGDGQIVPIETAANDVGTDQNINLYKNFTVLYHVKKAFFGFL